MYDVVVDGNGGHGCRDRSGDLEKIGQRLPRDFVESCTRAHGRYSQKQPLMQSKNEATVVPASKEAILIGSALIPALSA